MTLTAEQKALIVESLLIAIYEEVMDDAKELEARQLVRLFENASAVEVYDPDRPQG